MVSSACRRKSRWVAETDPAQPAEGRVSPVRSALQYECDFEVCAHVDCRVSSMYRYGGHVSM